MPLTGWNYRSELTVSAAQVDNTGPIFSLIGFTPLITEASVNAATATSIFANAKSDGSDIRVSTDSAGDNLLTVDVIDFDASGSTMVLRAGPTNLSPSVDTTLYIWWGNSGASAQTGSNAYASRWLQYLPLEADALDRTGQNDGTLSSLAFPADEIAGKVGKGLDLDGTGGGGNFDFITSGDNIVEGLSGLTVSAWVNAASQAASDEDTIFSNYQNGTNHSLMLRYDSTTNQIEVFFRAASTSQTGNHAATIEGGWHHVSFVWDSGGGYTVLVDGSSIGTGSALTGTTGISGNAGQWGATPHFASDGWLGGLDELQLHNAGGVAWSITEYNNTNAPGTFMSSGDPTDLSELPAGTKTTWLLKTWALYRQRG